MTYLIGLLSVVFLGLAIMIVSKSIALSKGIQGADDSDARVDGANNGNAFISSYLLCISSGIYINIIICRSLC